MKRSLELVCVGAGVVVLLAVIVAAFSTAPTTSRPVVENPPPDSSVQPSSTPTLSLLPSNCAFVRVP